MSKRVDKQTYLRIQKHILKKLYAHGAFQKVHMLFERLQNGIPPHLQGLVKVIINDLLISELVLLYAKTKYGGAYQLNIKKLKRLSSHDSFRI